ncbi:MAG: ATP-binding protein, partial [Oscillospiraceae bacterium]
KALLAAQQNKYYENQLELMKSSLTRAGIFRHDLNNQLSVIDAMVKEKNFDEVSVYVTKLIGAAKSLKNFANSGNINIDSILNFKLSQAEQENIKVTLLLEIPEKLSVCPVDVCSVLGNLLDNAICATCKLEEEQRRIDISVRFDKGRLIVQVDNSFNGQVFYNGEKIISSNKDKSCHGFGLLSVKNIVEKYNGLIDIEHSETEFKVTLLFFV